MENSGSNAHMCGMCGICGVGYGEGNDQTGSFELSMLLPCGHIYGSICMDAHRRSGSHSQSCPACQRSLLYQSCGHEIRLVPVAAAQREGGVATGNVPPVCVECDVKDFERRNNLPRLLAGLAESKQRYKELEERDNAAGVISNERVFLNVAIDTAEKQLSTIESQSRRLMEVRGRSIF